MISNTMNIENHTTYGTDVPQSSDNYHDNKSSLQQQLNSMQKEIEQLLQLNNYELKQHAKKLVEDTPMQVTSHILNQVLQLNHEDLNANDINESNSTITATANASATILNSITMHMTMENNVTNVVPTALAPVTNNTTQGDFFTSDTLNPMLQVLAATLLIMQQSDNAATLLAQSAKLQNALLDSIGEMEKFLTLMKRFYQDCLIQKQQDASNNKKPAPSQIDWADPDMKKWAQDAGYTVVTNSAGGNLWILFNTSELPNMVQTYAFDVNGHDGQKAISPGVIDSIIKNISQQISQVLPNATSSANGELYDTWKDGASSSTKNDQFIEQVANKIKAVSDSSGNISSQIAIYQNNKDNAKKTVDTIIQAILQAMTKLYS